MLCVYLMGSFARLDEDVVRCRVSYRDTWSGNGGDDEDEEFIQNLIRARYIP